MIHTTITHSFGVDEETSDSLCSKSSLATGWCYPDTDWFSMSLNKSQIQWSEWDNLVKAVSELRAKAKGGSGK